MLQRAELMRSSGLSPEKFTQAERMIRSVVQDMPRLRTRRESTGAPVPGKEPRLVSEPQTQSKRKEPRLDKSTLLERAKAVQSGALFRPKTTEAVHVPNPPAPTASVPRKVEAPVPTPEPATEANTEARKRTAMPRASSDSPAPPAVKTESEEVQAYQRLVSLGMPAHRQGLKFEIEPRRKRGRPPGQKKSIPQWMRDADQIASREPPLESTSSTGYLPARYATAKLTTLEEQWICPLPMPMMMSTANPSAVHATPSEVWARWAAQWDLL